MCRGRATGAIQPPTRRQDEGHRTAATLGTRSVRSRTPSVQRDRISRYYEDSRAGPVPVRSLHAKDAPVAQLDRASASGAEGHRFESCRARHISTRPATPPQTLSERSESNGRACHPALALPPFAHSRASYGRLRQQTLRSSVPAPLAIGGSVLLRPAASASPTAPTRRAARAHWRCRASEGKAPHGRSFLPSVNGSRRRPPCSSPSVRPAGPGARRAA